jgi:hypothetical protein
MRRRTARFPRTVVAPLSIAALCVSGLGGALAAVQAPPHNVCTGGDPIRDESPVSVSLTVSSSGVVEHADAVWRLSKPGQGTCPPVGFVYYAIDNGVVGRRPESISVLELVSFNPPLPTPTAAILLMADGVEKSRRPWRMFETAMTQISNGGPVPTAVGGVIPFNANLPEGGPDTGLASLIDGMGSGSVQSLELRLIGAKGRIINNRIYDLSDPPVFKPGALDPAMKDALAKASAPDHCAKPPGG